MHAILTAFEDEDAEAAKEALNRPCVKDLDIEFTRLKLINRNNEFNKTRPKAKNIVTMKTFFKLENV